MTVSSWDNALRIRYGGLADVLVPAFEDMPSATQADVATYWIDVALALRPDLGPGFFAALELAAGHPREAVAKLINEHPEAFAALGTLTAGAYFMNQRVRELIGYPGQTTRDLVDEVPLYLEMLQRVDERGFIYRPTPAAGDDGATD